MKILVQAQAIEGVEVPADSDPECAQEAVDGGFGKRWDEGVGEGASKCLLRERTVGVVKAEEQAFPELEELDEGQVIPRAQEQCERLDSLVANFAV